jgi:integrase
VVRQGKGRKDRITVLPSQLRPSLKEQLQAAHELHQKDLAEGAGRVALPGALALKYPGAAQSWSWQWVFPATRRYRDSKTGEQRRHHLHETVVQRAFARAVRQAKLTKRASCHSLRHSFATHLRLTGYGV